MVGIESARRQPTAQLLTFSQADAIELEPIQAPMPQHKPEETKLGSTAVEALEERLARARRRLNESMPSSPAWEAVEAEIEQLEANLRAMGRDPDGESR